MTATVNGISLFGAVDRLIVTPDRVTVIDFKSNIAVPDAAENCPEGLLRQMGAYAAMLEKLYPDREIQTGILWTTTQSYMELPQNIVKSAFARSPRLDAAEAAT